MKKEEFKKIDFVCFFDSYKYKEFLILYESIKDIYGEHEFKISIGIDVKTYEILKSKIDLTKINFLILNETDIENRFRNNKMLINSISKFTMLRLLMFQIFPDLLSNTNTVIYLDTDTFINTKIKNEYINSDSNFVTKDTFDLVNGEHWRDEYFSFLNENKNVLEKIKILLENNKYFNTGVMIINNKKAAEKIFDKSSDLYLKENIFDDQTMLNYWNSNEFEIVEDKSFNYMPIRQSASAEEEPSIYHFITKWKPYEDINVDKNSFIDIKKGFSDYLMLKTFINSRQSDKFNLYRNKIFDTEIKITESDLKLGNDITILLTIYKVNKVEMEYWIKSYKKLKSLGNEIHFLLDGKQSEENMKLFNQVDTNDLFISEENVGKARLVYEHVKSGFVKTKFLKTVDPDDYISIEKFAKINFDYSDDIIRIPTYIINNNFFSSDLKFIENFAKTNENIIWQNNFGTPITILPTKKMQNDIYFEKHKFKRVDIAEDMILGLICYANGSEIIEHKNDVFYLYKFENGISSKDTLEKSISFLYKQIIAIDVFNEIANDSGRTPEITYPSRPYQRFIDLEKKYFEEINKNPIMLDKFIEIKNFFEWLFKK